MRGRKLTEPMKAALAAMPFEVTMWGGKPMAGLPGKFTMSTLAALQQRGLAYTRTTESFRTVWHRRATPRPKEHITEEMVAIAAAAIEDQMASDDNYPEDIARAACEAVVPMVVKVEREFVATHRHRKGGEYRIVRRGRLEWNLEPAVIYEASDGTVWVRPAAEFDDGRFTAICSDTGGRVR